MNEDYPYQSNWEKYRFWWKFRWLLIVPLAGIILFVILGGVLPLDALRHPDGWTDVVFMILLCTVLPVFTFVSLKIQYWNCPRCGEWFHSSFFLSNILRSKCRHCGLHKYEGSAFYESWTRNEIW
jgi:ABC-type dipeptide/oligopeptide/nickel transport system permease component